VNTNQIQVWGLPPKHRISHNDLLRAENPIRGILRLLNTDAFPCW